MRSRRIDGGVAMSDWQDVRRPRRRPLLGVAWNPRCRADQGFGKDCWRTARALRRGAFIEELGASPSFRRIVNVARHSTRPHGADQTFEFQLATVTFEKGTETEQVVLHYDSRRV